METNKKNFFKVFKILIFLLILFLLYLTIKDAYSKYLTSHSSLTKSHISNWHILLNNEDITSERDFSEVVEIEIDQTEDISENVIAPTSTGHINLVLDSTDTELPFKYEIEPIIDDSVNLPDFKIYGYSVNDSEIIELSDDVTNVSDTVIPPTDADGNFTKEEVINNIVLYCHWYDEEDNILDNQNDVLVSKLENAIASVGLKVKVTQIKDTP